jgi:LysR family transcriptional regulator, glycine cleavage system transcriptional activator
MARSIPPLNPLHVFEVASRLGSFTKAAEELNVTQSAVSRQIATLEGVLGVPLFRRERQGISLTAAGENYRDEIIQAFELIASATARVIKEKAEHPLRIRVYNTFALKWLIPRMPRFHAQYPDVVAKLNTSVTPVDFQQDDADIAIQFGEEWKGCDKRLLVEDVLQPVCSPLLANQMKSVADLSKHRFIHARYRRADWMDWLTASGVPELWNEGTEFSSSALTYQAALEGIGVAMGQVGLLHAEIAKGSLVPLFQPVSRQRGYYIVWPSSRPLSSKAKLFISWIDKEAKRKP